MKLTLLNLVVSLLFVGSLSAQIGISSNENPSDVAVAATGWTDTGAAVRLNTVADSVGIGTLTPDTKLEVVGDILVSSGTVSVGVALMANMTGLVVEGGVLGMKEITTPTGDTNYGKLYTKTDNNVYFQDGAGTEHTLLKGSSSIQHEFFTPLEDPTGTVGNWDVITINSSQAVHFSCQIPEDFEVLDAATIVMIPDATETIQWDVLVSVSAAGEAYNNDDRSALNEQLAVTASALTEADISGVLTGLAAGDYVAIDFQSDTANLRIVGFEFDFN